MSSISINGNNGYFDDKIKDPSIRYGLNAVNNVYKHTSKSLESDYSTAPILNFDGSDNAYNENIQKLESFIKSNDEYLKSMPSLEFEYRYMPVQGVGKVDKKALLGAALGEMNAKELSVEEFENRFLLDEDSMTAKPLDINKDGKIDIAEYSTNILATDLLSKGTTDVSKIDGTINTKGLNAIFEYTKKANAQAASELYTKLYNTYDLGNGIEKLENIW